MCLCACVCVFLSLCMGFFVFLYVCLSVSLTRKHETVLSRPPSSVLQEFPWKGLFMASPYESTSLPSMTPKPHQLLPNEYSQTSSPPHLEPLCPEVMASECPLGTGRPRHSALQAQQPLRHKALPGTEHPQAQGTPALAGLIRGRDVAGLPQSFREQGTSQGSEARLLHRVKRGRKLLCAPSSNGHLVTGIPGRSKYRAHERQVGCSAGPSHSTTHLW